MVEWRRALAFFGTNRLRVTTANLNARHAQIQVGAVHLSDINPLFQALVLAHRLLPEVEAFTVRPASGGSSGITVAAADLRRTMPIWEYAVSTLDRMPFSTFLPMNLAARQATEDLPTALRSVAWIAVDDCLDAINGSPDYWEAGSREVLLARLSLIALAVSQVQGSLDFRVARLADVLTSVQQISREVAEHSPDGPECVDGLPSVERLRLQWARWGPVPRLPEVEGTGVTAFVDEPQPGLLAEHASYAYRTL